MSDLNLGKENESVNTEKPTADITKDKKQSLQERISNLPSNIDTAIEEGKANGIIEGIQDILQNLLTASFESCRLASLKLFMLTTEQRKKVSSMLYILAIIVAALLCVDLIFDFSIETILFAGLFILSAYLADMIVQKAILKTRKRTTLKVATKQKRKPPSTHNTDDDIL